MTRVLPYRSVEDRIEGVVITFVDVTDLKLVEEALRREDRRKEDFLATLAHELRNPLAALSNGLALLRISPRDARLADDTIRMMQRQLEQLVRLVDDLLDISRINHGKFRLQKTRVELDPIMQRALEAARAITRGREIVMELPGKPVWLDADPARMGQMLGNLLANACKFTGEGGNILLRAERHGDEVVIDVVDDGIGVAKERLPSLFHMFVQISDDVERAHRGLGIGLALVKRLAELHGGTVSVKSDGIGKGSTFQLRLPVAEPDDVRPQATPAVPAPLTGLRILIVDDNQDVARSQTLLLEAGGNQVSAVHGGDEAVGAAGSFQPDIMLLDLGMPDVDGYEVARRIRSKSWGSRILIVAVTGWGQEVDRRRTMAAGFDGHLVKPVEPGVLEKLIGELRANRDPQSRGPG